MKKVLYTVIVCLVAGLVSCDNDKIVTMDGSVDQKLDNVMKAWDKELTSSEHGWLANIHSDYGIYRFWMEFDKNGRVKMLTDNLNLESEKLVPGESSYTIRALQRPTLIFGTYSYVAVLNDPDDSISGGSNNEGLVTDFEFEISGYENGVFTMTGRINRVRAYLTKATEAEKTAAKEGALQDVITDYINYKNGLYLYSAINGKNVMYSFSQRSVSLVYLGDNEEILESGSDIYIDLTTKDVILDTPLDANGKMLTRLKWNEQTKLYVAVMDNGEELDLEEQDVPIIPLHLMLGLDKRYDYMETMIAFYPSSTTNVYRTALQTAATSAANNWQTPMAMHGFSFTFERDDLFEPRLLVAVYVDRYVGTYAIPITFNEEEDMFTCASSYSNANVNSATFYNGNVAKSMIDNLVGKTMRIDWTTVTYPGVTMGTLIQQSGGPDDYVDTDNIIYGAMY